MKTNLMKSILHLKDDTEYQIPLREGETEDRAKAGGSQKEKENNQESQKTKEDENNQLKSDSVTDQEHKNQMDVITQGEVDDADQDALEIVEKDPEEPQNQEPSNTENSSNDTTTDGVPPADTAKAALDEMKKLASQGGVIHPSLFISNFSKILGLMERAMQLQVKESGSVSKEEASKANEQAEVPEQTEVPAEGKQGELNDNTNNNRS